MRQASSHRAGETREQLPRRLLRVAVQQPRVAPQQQRPRRLDRAVLRQRRQLHSRRARVGELVVRCRAQDGCKAVGKRSLLLAEAVQQRTRLHRAGLVHAGRQLEPVQVEQRQQPLLEGRLRGGATRARHLADLVELALERLRRVEAGHPRARWALTAPRFS